MGNNTAELMMSKIKEGGVFVVTRTSNAGTDQVIAVTTSQSGAFAAIVEDGDFWHDGMPVSVTDKDVWGTRLLVRDESAYHPHYCFQKGQGMLQTYWETDWTPYRIQWTDLQITFA